MRVEEFFQWKLFESLFARLDIKVAAKAAYHFPILCQLLRHIVDLGDVGVPFFGCNLRTVLLTIDGLRQVDTIAHEAIISFEFLCVVEVWLHVG